MGEITRYLAEELETIIGSSEDKRVVQRFGKDILSNNIPSINKQLQNYEEASIDSIQQEVYEELVDAQDYNQIEQRLSLQRFGSIPIIPNQRILNCNLHVPQLDPNDYESFMKGEIELNELRTRYESIITKLHLFNKKLLEWKKELKRELEHSFQGFLYGYQRSHFKSFRDYYKQALETLLDI